MAESDQSPDGYTEMVWPSNIGGYAAYPFMLTPDGKTLEELSFTEEELHSLARRLHLDPQDLRERLTTRAGDLTLQQLTTVLDALFQDEDGRIHFQIEIGVIEKEFRHLHAPQIG